MGLRGWLAARAVRATRVLVVEAPGAFTARVGVEREVLGRGWRLADSPASADVLLTVGDVGEELAEVVEQLWAAMPGPRARGAVQEAGAAPAVLDGAAAALLDLPALADDAAGRTAPDLTAGDHEGHEGMDHGGHGGMDHGGGHAGMDHDGGHEGMDHGGHDGMDMAPGGIPLAEGSEHDRDGLEMDELPVRLGPVLPHWPPGVVLDVRLHGDLVVAARARFVAAGAHAGPETSPATRAARRCDDVAAALAIAGWDEGADLARTARDAILDHRGDDARGLLVDLRHRVEHSRPLRWSLRGVGVVPAEAAEQYGLPAGFAGDCFDRVLALVERAAAAAHDYAWSSGPGPEEPRPVSAPVPLEAWGPIVTGCDLAVARLVVATLGTPGTVVGVTTGA